MSISEKPTFWGRLHWLPILILAALLWLLVAACGPAIAPSGNAAALPGTDAASSDPAVSVLTGDGEMDTVNGNAPIAQETDAAGIPVGFTVDGRPYRGNLDAPVVIEEYSDYQCPYCARFYAQTLPALLQQQIAGGQAVLIYYDFPLTSIHPQAPAAANAARCAGEQGAAAYWAMHDLLFNNLGQWSDAQANARFSEYAAQADLDMERFGTCLESDKYAAAVQADLAHGQARGVSSTPTFFLNDQPLVGAQPLTVFNQAIATIQSGGQLAADSQQQNQQPAVAPTPAAFSDQIAAALGDPNASVTVVEFSDYQCPYCQRHSAQTMPQIRAELIDTGRVRYVFKDLPLDGIHPEARAAAVAARCAGEQDAYWEMHDALFARQAEWSGLADQTRPTFLTIADDLGLDRESYGSCLSSGRHDAAIQANVDEASALGIGGTPYFFVNGYPLNGARPIEHFTIAVGLAEEGRLADAFAPQEPQQPQQPAGPVEVPIGTAFTLGDPDAPITIVEYTDYQCPYCSRHFAQTLPQIIQQYVETGLVRYVIKDFTPTFRNPAYHPSAIVAAEAARCAGDQDAYLEMHDALFARQGEWSGREDPISLFTSYASSLGLDDEQFGVCLTSDKHQEAVRADFDEGVQLGVSATPTFFVNGYLLVGAQPFAAFQQAVASLESE